MIIHKFFHALILFLPNGDVELMYKKVICLILTNVKLRHAIIMIYFLTIFDGAFQDLTQWHLSRTSRLLKGATIVYGERSMS